MRENATGEEVVVAFDVGNTSVKGARLEEGGCDVFPACATHPLESLSERLRASFPARLRPLVAGARCIASSVCPAAEEALRELWKALGGRGRVEFFGRDLPVPIETLVEEPQKVGADRLLCALGAKSLAGAPCIAIGVGSAVTVDLVDPQGRFAGGAIAPGFRLAARALSEGTALLPRVEPGRPERTVGRNTEEAIRSGTYWFCLGGVAALIGELRETGGCGNAPVVLTGGDAELLRSGLPEEDIRVEPDLIFLGMSKSLR